MPTKSWIQETLPLHEISKANFWGLWHFFCLLGEGGWYFGGFCLFCGEGLFRFFWWVCGRISIGKSLEIFAVKHLSVCSISLAVEYYKRRNSILDTLFLLRGKRPSDVRTFTSLQRYINLLSSVYFRIVSGFFSSVAFTVAEYMIGEVFGKSWASKRVKDQESLCKLQWILYTSLHIHRGKNPVPFLDLTKKIELIIYIKFSWVWVLFVCGGGGLFLPLHIAVTLWLPLCLFVVVLKTFIIFGYHKNTLDVETVD